MPRLGHEQPLTDKAHQTDTPSPATTLNPMALDSKADLHELTASATNALAKIDLSTTQSPPQPDDDETTSQPTNESLPVELWMRVFEYLHNTKDYARSSVITDYRSSLAILEDSVEAAQTLPPFEKRT